MLLSAGWVSREALAALPTLPAATGRLDYLPLAELDADPELVLLSLSPEQLMPVQAAIPALKLTGKPQCQIIPMAAAGVPCVSLGCAVSRARTGADPARMTCALPTHTLLDAVDALEAAGADAAGALEAKRFRARALGLPKPPHGLVQLRPFRVWMGRFAPWKARPQSWIGGWALERAEARPESVRLLGWLLTPSNSTGLTQRRMLLKLVVYPLVLVLYLRL